MIDISVDSPSCLVCESLRVFEHTVGPADTPTRVLPDPSASVYIREGVFKRLVVIMKHVGNCLWMISRFMCKERSFVREQFLHLLRVYSVLTDSGPVRSEDTTMVLLLMLLTECYSLAF
jgi:hypothetical protein